MIRTQIYLSDVEKTGLSRIAAQTGMSQSDLIRHAIDAFIEGSQDQDRTRVIQDVAGVWAARKNLPDLRDLRTGWNNR
jgi:hypothetical protein